MSLKGPLKAQKTYIKKLLRPPKSNSIDERLENGALVEAPCTSLRNRTKD